MKITLLLIVSVTSGAFLARHWIVALLGVALAVAYVLIKHPDGFRHWRLHVVEWQIKLLKERRRWWQNEEARHRTAYDDLESSLDGTQATEDEQRELAQSRAGFFAAGEELLRINRKLVRLQRKATRLAYRNLPYPPVRA